MSNLAEKKTRNANAKNSKTYNLLNNKQVSINMTLYEIHAITFSVNQNINQSKKLSIIFSQLMNQSVSDA